MKKKKIAILLAGTLVASILGAGLESSVYASTSNVVERNLKQGDIDYYREGFSQPTSTYGKVLDYEDGFKLRFGVNRGSSFLLGFEIRKNGQKIAFTSENEYIDKNADKSISNKYEIIPVSQNLGVGTSIVLDTGKEDNTHVIDVNGVDYYGTKQVTVMKINMDYSDNTIYLSSRGGGAIHAGLGIDKYFQFTLYDKNMKEKNSFKMASADISAYVKYNNFNLTRFELGDYVEIYHEEPMRLTVDGEKATSKKTLYRITKYGLVPVVALDGTTINLGGSGSGSFGLDFTSKILTVKDRTGGSFASEYTGFTNYYIRVTLSDKNGNIKTQSNLYGSMYARNIEVDKLNGVRYNYGDIVTINHMAPSHISLKGAVLGAKLEGNNQQYEITKEGLKAVTTINGTNIHFGGSGTGAFDLEINNKTLYVKNRTTGTFASKFYDYGLYTRYMRLMLRDKEGRVKLDTNIYGSMTPQNLEISRIDGTKFEYGDTFTIYHRDAQYLKINGPIIGKIDPPLGYVDPDDDYAETERTLTFEMTEDGLKVIE